MATTWPTAEDATTTKYTSTSAAPAGNVTAAGYTGTGYNATNGTAASAGLINTANTANWNVAAPQTVQGQVANIIDANSPLMQRAETRAKQAMNGSGLLNSSMAVGAGQAALYDAAMPMATQDASTNANAAQFNANAANQNSQFNASAANTRDQFNAANQQQTNMANADAANRAAEYSATAKNTSAQYNAGATNTANQFNASNQQQTNLANAQASNTAAQFNAQQENAQSQFNAGQTNEIIKQGMEMDNRTELANIESNYKTLLSANQSASDMYQQTIKNIETIQTNKDITADVKTTYIKNQLTYLKTFMQMTETMNSLSGLDELIVT